MAYLPNIEGYEFIAILIGDSEIDSIVKKNENGSFYVDNFKDIIGWKVKQKNKKLNYKHFK
jgi:hypothetical protein